MLPIIIQTTNEADDTYLKPFLTKHTTLVFQITPDKKRTISIKQTKKLLSSFVQNFPQNKLHIFNIHNAHKLTIPAQNNLLKILEEGAVNKLITLATPHPNLLLETIISRCQLKHTTSNKKDTHIILSPPLQDWTSNIGEIIALSDKISTQNTQKYLQDSLYLIRQANRQTPKLKRVKILKAINICLQDLSANINPKLAIDNLFFSIRHYLSS